MKVYSLLITLAAVTLSSVSTGQVPQDLDALSGASFEYPPALPVSEESVRPVMFDWLGRHWIMTLATTDSDGSAHASAVVYALKDEELFFVSSRKSMKIQNILRNPRVSGTVMPAPEDFRDLKAVQFKGLARVIEGSERTEISRLFEARSFGDQYAVIGIRLQIARWIDRSNEATRSSVISFSEKPRQTLRKQP